MTKEGLEKWIAEHPMPDSVDWTELMAYEKDDNTITMQTLACSAGVCEI